MARIDQILRGETFEMIGICYTSEGDCSLEGVEVRAQYGPPLVLTSATDWSLRVEQKDFPNLPSWCYPPEVWSYCSILPAEEGASIGKCQEIVEHFNEVDQLVGVTLIYPRLSVAIHSGEEFRVQVAKIE